MSRRDDLSGLNLVHGVAVDGGFRATKDLERPLFGRLSTGRLTTDSWFLVSYASEGATCPRTRGKRTGVC